jgi:glycopeptide antibiotics resistance protein
MSKDVKDPIGRVLNTILAAMIFCVLALVGIAFSLVFSDDGQKSMVTCIIEGNQSFYKDNLEVAYVNQAGTMLLYSAQRRVKEDIYKLHDGENCQIRSYEVKQ